MIQEPMPRLTLISSPEFGPWLSGTGCSLAVTTGAAGRLLLVGTDDTDEIHVCDRILPDCAAVAASDLGFWVNSQYQIWRFENFLDPGVTDGEDDGFFVPVTGHTTGDLDLHDMHIGPEGTPIFVATAFNCLAVKSDSASFRPLWHPEFIDGLIGEDQCHLTGLAADEGIPAFVSLAAESSEPGGWQRSLKNGGQIIDIATDEVVAAGLSLPHAPRVFHSELLVLQAGTGELGLIEIHNGKFEPIAWLPGHPRAMAFIGMHAIVGTSTQPVPGVTGGTLLSQRLEEAGTTPRCGLFAINLLTGRIDHWLEIEGLVTDVAGVAALPGTRHPMAIGFRSEEIRFTVRPDYF